MSALVAQRQRGGLLSLDKSDGEHSYLSFYHREQDMEVTIEDLTVHALHREQMFRQLESMDVRGADLKSKIKRLEMLEEKYSFNFLPIANEDNWRNDLISHHVLKLLYADADVGDKRFFVEQESRLFEARLSRLFEARLSRPQNRNKELQTILKRAGLRSEWCVLDEDDDEYKEVWENMCIVDEIRKKTNSGSSNREYQPGKHPKVYEIPFQSMIRSVQRRDVYLRRGNAYITERQFIDWLCEIFRAKLREQMEAAKSHYKKILAEDDRIKMFATIKEELDNDTDNNLLNIGELTSNSIDYWAKEAFPLCMKMMHYHLSVDSRLGHNGRLQYGLFLKGSGLPLDEAMIYFRQHFTRKITVDEFTKRYAYNIRYNYGQEGKRANFQPHSCQHIIMRSRNNPNELRDPHGCPFRNWSDAKYRRFLELERLDSNAIAEISSLAGEHPQRACILHFMKKFPEADSTTMGTHPHKYYISARLHLQHQKSDSQAEKDGQTSTSAAPKASDAPAAATFQATSTPAP